MADVIKVTLVCDSCGAEIADGISANAMRLEAQALYGRHTGRDLCLACEARALTGPAATRASPSTSELLVPAREPDARFPPASRRTCKACAHPGNAC